MGECGMGNSHVIGIERDPDTGLHKAAQGILPDIGIYAGLEIARGA